MCTLYSNYSGMSRYIHYSRCDTVLYGPIWKEDDVVEALEEKRIMGVGSDVYETEPPPDDHPLFKMDSFAGTPICPLTRKRQ
ncbi:MAG: NAD(P)-dependent oxidoreductase [Pseudomonadota bacterium]